MPDKSSKFRTISELENCAKLPKTSKKRFNCSNPPIFPSIPMSNVVVYILHLFLRITDILMNLLILGARRLDAIDKLNKFAEFNPQKFQHCHELEKFLKESGIVGFNFYVGKDSKKLKWPTLNGPQKHKLFACIKVAEILPELGADKLTKIQFLWDEFYVLGCIKLKSANGIFSKEDVDEYESRLKKWLNE